MIERIIRQVVDNDLQTVAGIFSLIGGVVSVQRKSTGAGTVIYPAELKYTADCETGEYQSFMPDSAYTGILYWEHLGVASVIDKSHSMFQQESNLRLVGWLNSAKIDDSYLLAANVVNAVKRRQDNIGSYLQNIFIDYQGFEEKTAAIFSRYNYDEARSQYLMKPYDYFSIKYKVQWLFIPSCATEAQIVANDCA